MRPLTRLAAALLVAAPLFAAEAPKTDNTQTQAATQQDSPLVAAAKRAKRARTGKTIVITNATLAKSSGAGITTTDSQPEITLPDPDAALLAMEKASQPQAKPAQAGSPSPAAARAEDSGPYSNNPQLYQLTVATTQNPSSASTQNPTSTSQAQNPSFGQTQNPTQGQTQSPDQMQKKP